MWVFTLHNSPSQRRDKIGEGVHIAQWSESEDRQNRWVT